MTEVVGRPFDWEVDGAPGDVEPPLFGSELERQRMHDAWAAAHYKVTRWHLGEREQDE